MPSLAPLSPFPRDGLSWIWSLQSRGTFSCSRSRWAIRALRRESNTCHFFATLSCFFAASYCTCSNFGVHLDKNKHPHTSAACVTLQKQSSYFFRVHDGGIEIAADVTRRQSSEDEVTLHTTKYCFRGRRSKCHTHTYPASPSSLVLESPTKNHRLLQSLSGLLAFANQIGSCVNGTMVVSERG